VLLRVSDTGRGMDDAQLQQAFEPFNRLGRENDGIEGTGIGLSIVRALVDRMGGTDQVRSAPGQGSVFEVWLGDGERLQAMPGVGAVSRAAVSDAAETMPPMQDRAGHGRPARLLYIEDNPVNMLIVQELLGARPKLLLDTAVDGLGGVRQAVQGHPDLILVDMQLPDIDGYEVLRRLRAEAATAAIPCIAVSANALPEDIQRARNAGFADYWTKPLACKPSCKRSTPCSVLPRPLRADTTRRGRVSKLRPQHTRPRPAPWTSNASTKLAACLPT